jgi:hypothetical protein
MKLHKMFNVNINSPNKFYFELSNKTQLTCSKLNNNNIISTMDDHIILLIQF